MKLHFYCSILVCLLIGCNRGSTDSTTANIENQIDSLKIANQFAQCIKNQDSSSVYIANAKKIVEINNNTENNAHFLFCLVKIF